MRLLILAIEFPPGPGGLGVLAYRAALHLSRLGWQVCVATPQRHATPDEIERFNQSQPFEIISFVYEGPLFIEAALRFGSVARRTAAWHPDAILSIAGQPTWLGALLSILFRLPLAAVGVGTEFLTSGYSRPLTGWAFKRASLVLFISEYTRRLAQAEGIRLFQSEVIPLGADADAFQPGLPTGELRQRFGLENARVLLTVGRVCERKAQDIVIQALPAILERNPDVRYVIAGLPEEQNRFQDLAQRLGVEEKVIFAGKVSQEDLPSFYNLADLFVLVSRRTSQGEVEGFGIVTLEAALCELPAVVSSQSGLAETVQDGVSGLLVPPEDPQATTQAVLRLLEDESLRQSMGQAARQAVLAQATWEKRIAAYDRALKAMLSGG